MAERGSRPASVDARRSAPKGTRPPDGKASADTTRKRRPSLVVGILAILGLLFGLPFIGGVFLGLLRRPATRSPPFQGPKPSLDYRKGVGGFGLAEGPAEPDWQGQMLATVRAVNAHKPDAIRARSLLDYGEQTVFDQILEAWAQEKQLRLLVQVSMGEFLMATAGDDTDEVRRSFNSKRVDFLICDWRWDPVIVVEYFGRGHGQADFADRDAIKAEVLCAARIGLIIVGPEDTPTTVHAALDLALAKIKADRRVYPVFPKRRPGVSK